MIATIIFWVGILLLLGTLGWAIRTRHYVIAGGIIPWSTRTLRWMRLLGGSGVDTKGARVSDFVGVAGFSLSVLAIVFGWYSIVLQTEKASLDQEARDLSEKIIDKQQQISTGTSALQQKQSSDVIHLGVPRRDAQLVGPHVDLEWKYNGHSPFLTYVVEIANKKQSGLQMCNRDPHVACTLDKYQSCRFVATDPAGQHTQILGAKVGRLAGDYLWRVVPARRANSASNNCDVDQVADWSQFRMFTVFPSIRDRIRTTGNILVGTTYSEDARFSTIGEDGYPRGNDVDLIQVLIEGCLTLTGVEQWPLFDARACRDAVSQYKDHYVRSERDGQLRVSVKPFPTVQDGLEALGRREIDVFIGSLTKARKRERGPILFTDGYYPFETRLYARRETGKSTLWEWAAKKETLGVINNSSNHWLATFLTSERILKDRLTLVTFDDFPTLESAFDRGEVDGVLLDDVLSNELNDAVALEGLKDTDAWKSYHDDANALGLKTEQFAIAVVMDTDVASQQSSMISRLVDKLGGGEERHGSQESLYGALQHALRTQEVQLTLLPKLRQSYEIPEPSGGQMRAHSF
jgi:ABC-type amino acid transport substrate-binding protein